MPVLAWTIGAPELMVVLVLVLILFGAGKLPQVFAQLGSAMKNFRDAQKDPIDLGPNQRLAAGVEAEEVTESQRERERA